MCDILRQKPVILSPTWLRIEGDHLAGEQLGEGEGGEEGQKEDRSREPHHRRGGNQREI